MGQEKQEMLVVSIHALDLVQMVGGKAIIGQRWMVTPRICLALAMAALVTPASSFMKPVLELGPSREVVIGGKSMIMSHIGSAQGPLLMRMAMMALVGPPCTKYGSDST